MELGLEVLAFTGGRLETIEVRRGVKMAYSGGRCVERYLLLPPVDSSPPVLVRCVEAHHIACLSSKRSGVVDGVLLFSSLWSIVMVDRDKLGVRVRPPEEGDVASAVIMRR